MISATGVYLVAVSIHSIKMLKDIYTRLSYIPDCCHFF